MERKRTSGHSNNSTSAHNHHQSPPVFPQGGDTVTRNIDLHLDLDDQGSEVIPEVKVVKVNEDGGEEAANSKPDHPPFSFSALPAEKKWTLIAMAFANFAACTCFSLLAPFFPKEAEKKGASVTVTGLIFSTFELWIFVSSPFYGNFMTRIGARFMFLSGLFTCGTCAILFGLLDQSPPGNTFVVLCFLVRSVEALGASAFITASFAIIANTFPNHVSTVFGALETFSGLGLMVGPPIGGALYELGGYGLPFWVMGGLLFLCAILVFLLLPSSEDGRRHERGSVISLLTSPLVLVTCITVAAGSLSLGFLDPTLAAHLDPYHLSSAVVGLIFIVAPAVYAFLAPVWGYLSDRKGLSFHLVLFGNVVCVFAFIIIGPCPLLPFLPQALWIIIVGLGLAGLGVGSALVCALKCLVIGAQQVGFEDNLDTFGLISGLFNSTFSLGMFIGPTVGSILVDEYGFDWAATATAFVFAACALLFLLYIVISRSCTSSSSSSSSPSSSSSSCCSCCCPGSRSSDDEDSPSRSLLRKDSVSATAGAAAAGASASASASYSSIGHTTTIVVSPPGSPAASDNR